MNKNTWTLPYRISITLITAILWWMLSTRLDWDKNTRACVNRMMGFTFGDKSAESHILLDRNKTFPKSDRLEYSTTMLDWDQDAFCNLPFVVQRYFHRAFLYTGEEECLWKDYIKMIDMVSIDESGEMLIDGKWVPFAGTNIFSAVPGEKAGFVCDTKIKYPGLVDFPYDIIVRIRDSYIERENKHNKVSMLLGIFPMQLSEESEDSSASRHRWLSHTPFFPTSILPREGGEIEWVEERKKHWPFQKLHRNDVRLIHKDTHGDTDVEVHFNAEGLIDTITWIGKEHQIHMSDYKTFGASILSPSYIEAGTVESGVFVPRIKTAVKDVKYTYFN